MLLLLPLERGRSCVLVGGCDDTDCDKEDETEDFTASGVLEEKIKKGNALLTCSVKVTMYIMAGYL